MSSLTFPAPPVEAGPPASTPAPDQCPSSLKVWHQTHACTQRAGHVGWHMNGPFGWPEERPDPYPGPQDAPRESSRPSVELVRVGPDPLDRTNDDGTPILTVFYRDRTISPVEVFYCWLAHWSKDLPQPDLKKMEPLKNAK